MNTQLNLHRDKYFWLCADSDLSDTLTKNLLKAVALSTLQKKDIQNLQVQGFVKCQSVRLYPLKGPLSDFPYLYLQLAEYNTYIKKKVMCSSPTRYQALMRQWAPAYYARNNLKGALPQGLLCSPSARNLSSGEAFTALKPFFFAVHPDLFGQFPKERAINENSLKQLNAYIEAATIVNTPLKATHLTFYLRPGSTFNATQTTPQANSYQFQSVKVVLGNRDVRKTVHSILEMCNLPTAYLDKLPQNPADYFRRQIHPTYQTYNSNVKDYYWSKPEDVKDVEDEIKEAVNSQDTLRHWLNGNVMSARKKLLDCWPIREEIVRLKKSICDSLGVKDVIWDCGWGTRHWRGCLQSFAALAAHHPESMGILKGKTIIFGRDTGINLDGHVILNSGEVRSNWHDLIKRANKHNYVISRIPRVELALSRALKDINVVHRKFEPTRMADMYESNLRKLITSIGDYRGRCSFPSQWPQTLSHLELVVETDSGPLMVSPTGQIIVPSSCPPFLLVNFITDRMEEASLKLAQYKRQKYEEKDLHTKCTEQLGLFALEKADNITPDLMIDCLNRLLARAEEFNPILTGAHLWVTTYYSVQSDGEICIPWNWK